jgi:hypothetical protein
VYFINIYYRDLELKYVTYNKYVRARDMKFSLMKHAIKGVQTMDLLRHVFSLLIFVLHKYYVFHCYVNTFPK